MSSPFEALLGESLSKEELDVVLYIYIGQNIRDQGILEQDSYLRKMASFVESLVDKEIVEQSRWYSFNVLTISYRFTVPIRELMEARLRNEKEKLVAALQPIPENLLSFLVFEYLSYGLSFPVLKDWLFDWRGILLENSIIRKHKRIFFKTLIDFGFCVKTRNYVSTRGGELREEEYVINAEVRNFLQEVTSHRQFPSSFRDLAAVQNLMKDAVEYQKGMVELAIKDEELAVLGSHPDKMKETFDALLVRLKSANVVDSIEEFPDWGTQLVVNRNTLLRFIQTDVNQQIVKPLLSKRILVPKEEIKEESPNFLKLVQTLIDRKFSVYKTAAQFGGKEVFKSLPYIERCVIDLTDPLSGEAGLRKFVGDLHQVLEEASTKEVLKFREGEAFTSLEDWLDIEIPSEASSFYENAKQFFRDLNRLRNFYSHTLDAKGIFEAGLIFDRLIGKYSPEEDDIVKTEVILLERSIRALEELDRTLRMAWQKKMRS